MKKLRIYQEALDLIRQIYLLVNSNKTLSRDFSLVDQLKRASVSVLANIAEGYQRSLKLNRHYLSISSGSANEMIALLDVANTIYQIDTSKLQAKYDLLGRKITAFSKSLKPKKTDNRRISPPTLPADGRET